MSETSTFRTVLRGYEPAQVDQRIRELSEALYVARQQSDELAKRVQALEAAEAERAAQPAPQPEQVPAPEPTFADLGARIGQILQLADDEAADLRRRAHQEAETHRRDVEEASAIVRAEADRYAENTRSAADSEAARVLEDARRRADEILDEADRDATARREE
ncbi:MAG: hypothetical protein ACOYXW_10570, partial [Actinomycetota bacterium]